MNSYRRYRVFFGRMFPLAVMIPWCAAAFLVVYLSLQALGQQTPLRLTWRAGLGVVTVILFSLLMRIYDELKDAEADIRLAAAGDPNYQNRPIATGEITVPDLIRLRWYVTAALVAVNLPLGFPLPLLGFLVAFFLMWLSFKWFFCPAISRNLLLAFVTHNPLALVISAYVVTVYVRDFGADRLTAWTVPLLIGTWMPVAAWETSRKIRLPEDETDYQTYSKLLGWKTATMLPVAFVLISLAFLMPLANASGLGWVFHVVLIGGASAVIGACLLLIVAPTSNRCKLRPYTELYGVVVNMGLAVALVMHHGVTLS